MIKKIYCELCGAEFLAHYHTQKYCSDECRAHGKKIKTLEWKKKHASAKPTAFPSIEEMVDVALRLSEKYGKHLGYGDIQKMLLTGKLKVEDGVIAYGE